MRMARSSIPWIAIAAAGFVAHCGSNADKPPTTITKPVDAGTPDIGTGGTGGTGIIGVDVAAIVCTDETDTDGDGIADEIEGTGDADGDGTPNREDDDSDDDGLLDADEAGPGRTGPCSEVVNTDGLQDGPDFLDPDSDDDGVPDKDDQGLCPNKDCRVLSNCDDDPESVIDIVEVAAGGDPCDGLAPADAGLYFVVPYDDGERRKNFDFSTGVKDADIYFLIDTTTSMQPAIDNIKASLDTEIIPTVLNGDKTAVPEIPAIPGAWIGIGDFKDVNWSPWGIPGDYVYGFKFDLGGSTVYGNVSPPIDNGGVLGAPDNVRTILDSLTAIGGGDSPESTTQALWLASTNQDYRAVGGGEPWPPNENPPTCGMPVCFDAADWRAKCDDPSQLGRACFRPGKLPIFVIVTDAGFHNGPTAPFDYVVPPDRPPSGTAVNGTKTYAQVLKSMNDISAKVVGVSVDTGLPGQARNDLIDLAQQTGSLFFDPKFGGAEKPLVTEKDTRTGDVSTEVVRLIGLLAGQGLNNVTTVTTNYDCDGGKDCNGDGAPDPAYHNFPDGPTSMPFDASRLIKDVHTVPSMANPKPYASLNASTFFGVRGDATVEFEVVAENNLIQTNQIVVVRALLRVQTPTGLALGGPAGVKVIYLVIPPYVKGAA